MSERIRSKTSFAARAIAMGMLSLSAGCGEDSASGPGNGDDPPPVFGDITFTPSFDDIGSARSTQLVLRNTSSTDFGSVVVGVDVIQHVSMPGTLCSTIVTDVTPSSIPSFASGEDVVVEVTFDTENAEPDACPAGQYDADLLVVTEGTTVGGATIRFVLEAPPSPMFGDIAFTPSFENIGSGRSIQLIVRNVSSHELGPVVIGTDFPKQVDMPDAICTTMGVDVDPGSIASLAPDEEIVIIVTFDTQSVDPDCPAGQYDADLFATVDGSALGGATIRFNWAGTAP